MKIEDLERIIREEVKKTLSEISPEDETMIFRQMIRTAAKDIITTHNTLTPVQQEAYEDLLIQAGQALSEKREEEEKF